MSPHERISAAIRAAGDEGRTALVAFITAGYPKKTDFRATLAEVAGAADVVEVGVPFTDPMADGLTIQRASREAIAQGVTLSWILDEIAAMDPPPAAPVVLMSYLNPLLAMGYERLAQRAIEAGVDGFIVPDLPLDESGPLDAALAAQGLALVHLVSPVTPPVRIEAAARASRGFLYAVNVTGITGGAQAANAGLHDYLGRIVAASTVPVCAGFGVRSAAQVSDLGQVVPGVIVGSALVEALERGESPAAFLGALRTPAG
ncbi:MAG: tryptophan synthase subunit alpha [Gammaproteobacteria bacterium]